MSPTETTTCADCAEPLTAAAADLCGCPKLHLCAACGRRLAEPSPLCESHHETEGEPLLDWRDRAHTGHREAPCRFCGGATLLRDAAGRPAHKICTQAAAFGGAA